MNTPHQRKNTCVCQDEGVPGNRGMAFFIGNDNLRKGVALKAVQIAGLVAAQLPVAWLGTVSPR